MSSPDLTILLPAFNAEAVIEGTIRTLLNQTYRGFELWVLENGSTDRTAEIARSFTDHRVRVFELGPIGFQGALQYGLENATSDWVARMDADDLVFPRRLEVQMEVLKSRTNLGFVGTGFAILTPFGHVLEQLPTIETREVDTTYLGRGRGRFADPSTILNRKIALEAGGVDPEFSMGDVPLLFRILRHAKGWQIGETHYVYRLRPTSMSKGQEFYQQTLRARLKYSPDTVGNWNPNPRKNSFWSQVAGYALIAGDVGSARIAVNRITEEYQTFSSEAKRMRLRCLLGAVVPRYYSYRNRKRFVRRPDWEILLKRNGGMLSEYGPADSMVSTTFESGCTL